MNFLYLDTEYFMAVRISDLHLALKNFAIIEFKDEFKADTALATLNGTEYEGCTPDHIC